MRNRIGAGLWLGLLFVLPVFSQNKPKDAEELVKNFARPDFRQQVPHHFSKQKPFQLDKYFLSWLHSLDNHNRLARQSADNLEPAWVRQYGSGLAPGFSVASAIVVDGSGNIYITGRSSNLPFGLDYLTVKYNASGTQVWASRYDGPGHVDDIATKIGVDGSGNVYVTGGSFNSGTNFDYATIKYNSDGIQQWVARYDGPAHFFDVASSLAVDGSGNVYVTGASADLSTGLDYLTIKYNSTGIQQWISQYSSAGNNDDQATALALDGAENVHVTGSSAGDYATIKYNSSGAQQWVAQYDGPGNGEDQATGIGVDGAGNIYVTGASEGTSTGNDYATLKYNSSGAQVWLARYDGPAHAFDEAAAIVVAGSNVYVTGASIDASSGADYTTIKYNLDGVQQWNVRYDGSGSTDEARAIAGDNSGNIYVTGISEGSTTGNDYATIKYNSAGVQQWAVRYNDSGDEDEANAIAVDDAGNVYVTGSSVSTSTGGAVFATLKYNSAGVQQSISRSSSTGNSFDIGLAMAVDGAGNIYVTGYGIGPALNYQFATLKYSPDGTQQWAVRYDDGPTDHEEEKAVDIVVDGAGNAYVTGIGYEPGTGFDYVTIKYSSSGVQLWVVRYNGPGNGDDEPVRAALDGSGNVYVMGKSIGAGTGDDYATVKYNTNGVEQWVARYNGPANGFDAATAIRVDGSGNIYVTGESDGGVTFSDYATIKYNSAGVQQWVARYNGVENFSDRANALAIDGSENVYVTGKSFSAGSGDDYATVKYNASGVQQWVANHNGSANDDDEATAITIDASGNIIVTGSSENTATSFDYVTIKYSPASGSVQWVATYSGPGDSFDTPAAIVSDAADNVYLTGASGPVAFIFPFTDYATVKYTAAGAEAWVSRFDGPGYLVTDFAFDIALDPSNSDLVYVTGISVSLSGLWSTFTTIKYDQSMVAVKEQETLNPYAYSLTQNYPNPFNPSTRIKYHVAQPTHVTLKVYDVLGQEVATLVNEKKQPGSYEVSFEASGLKSGVYFYRMEAGDPAADSGQGFVTTKKLLLVK